MDARGKCFRSRRPVRAAVSLLALLMLWSLTAVTAFAAEEKTAVAGRVYTFEEDSRYAFSGEETYAVTDGENTYGVFSVSGAFSSAGSRGDVPAYEVEEGNLSLFYDHGDALLNAGADEWHLVEDKGKEVETLTLEDKLLRGALILQTSRDRLSWVDALVLTDAFHETPVRTEEIYSTTDVQLVNGCYYRLIVAYELAIRTEESSILFVNTDQYDHRKYAEVYEFYAYTDSGAAELSDPQDAYELGERVRVSDFDGYSGQKEITEDDIHYNWKLGAFCVSGHTDEIENEDGSVTFLKNVGDRVTLWFCLDQNIDALNEDEKLSITADDDGQDLYFETPKMDFGRGTLIIRYTDDNNKDDTPIIYTNFLEANTVPGANTKVQLFEEGDYEVALDYEVTRDGLIDSVGHYRIFFRFSVRNGNCMVYPFDVETGSELTNSSMTEHGFRLDLARSRYLTVNIKRDVLTESADGLVEDTRFNGIAQDGEEFTEEGIYTITAHNRYTNQYTVKKIYVGTNDVLRAYMATGLSIPEINELLEQGAVILEDGTIELAAPIPEEVPPEEPAAAEEEMPVTEEAAAPAVEEAHDEERPEAPEETMEEPQQTAPSPVPILAAGLAACAGVALVLVLRRRRARAGQAASEKAASEPEGGEEG